MRFVIIASLVAAVAARTVLDDDFVIEDPYLDLEDGGDKHAGSRTDQQYEEDFKDFDTNNDGGIDPQEVRAVYKGFMDQADLFKFYSEADKNEDGLIELDEYKAYVRSLLTTLRVSAATSSSSAIDASIGATERLSKNRTLEGCESFPYSPLDYVIQEVDSQQHHRLIPSAIRKKMAMSQRKKAALKDVDQKLGLLPAVNGEALFMSFTLCKAGMSTVTAIARIANATGIPIQEFIFTDKTESYALTGQRVCVRSDYLSTLREFEAQQDFLGGFGVTECSYLPEDTTPYSPHLGSSYRLRYRNVDHLNDKAAEQALAGLAKRGFVNYYPPQRFPMNSHLVGEALVEKDFIRATRLLIEWFRNTTTSETLKEAADEYLFSADPDAAISVMNKGNIQPRSSLYRFMETLRTSSGGSPLEGALRTYQDGRFWNICVNQANPSWKWNISAAKRVAKSEQVEAGDVVFDEGRLRRVTADMVDKYPITSLMLPRASLSAEGTSSAIRPAGERDHRFLGEIWADRLVEGDGDSVEAYVATDTRFRGNVRYRPVVVAPRDARLHFELVPTSDVAPPKRNAIVTFTLPSGASGMALHKELTGGTMSVGRER
ncbi:hypothetical protein FOZ63_012814 [Perkinsus olseni]|uniref:EF-hand domain-containing protein n=1 Tax=Perkinsus olseni TaxID=32597 RepID=A0A7J6PVU7_PEROL|nr:hypothetical protein FOZ63_012814 [Perkinsus olseni]KAF4743856.1 hypothetical protein FOZ62_005927 [Perkinsus olseni]